MTPPREEGWFADDLDHLPDAPRRTELVDGALVFHLYPQSSWHARVVRRLTAALEHQAPSGFEAEYRMSIRQRQATQVRQRGNPPLLAGGGGKVRVHELDLPTGTYAEVTVAHGILERPVPFPLTIDLADLV
jgi:hypothetical protein